MVNALEGPEPEFASVHFSNISHKFLQLFYSNTNLFALLSISSLLFKVAFGQKLGWLLNWSVIMTIYWRKEVASFVLNASAIPHDNAFLTHVSVAHEQFASDNVITVVMELR